MSEIILSISAMTLEEDSIISIVNSVFSENYATATLPYHRIKYESHSLMLNNPFSSTTFVLEDSEKDRQNELLH